MATYLARMLDANTGGEGQYRFEGPSDLFKKTADEIVGIFFDHVEKEVLTQHVDWEVNAAFKNKERRVVTAIGSLVPAKDEPEMPFMLMISEK
jgi:hypothetical protein